MMDSNKMEIGTFYVEKSDKMILSVLSHFTSDEIKSLQQVCERYGEDTDDVRYYDVYIVETTGQTKILKKTSEREVFNYENYLKGNELDVPQYYGKWNDGDNVWILINTYLI